MMFVTTIEPRSGESTGDFSKRAIHLKALLEAVKKKSFSLILSEGKLGFYDELTLSDPDPAREFTELKEHLLSCGLSPDAFEPGVYRYINSDFNSDCTMLSISFERIR